MMHAGHLRFLIGTAATCGLFLRWLPRRPLNAEEQALQHSLEDQSEDWRVPKILPIFCLVAVCFTYINIGGYYTNVYMHHRKSADIKGHESVA